VELNLLKRKREILDETKKIRRPEKALAHWESTTPVRL
jgi:hypothetical protein